MIFTKIKTFPGNNEYTAIRRADEQVVDRNWKQVWEDRLVGRLGGAGHTKELRPYPIAAEEASGASLKKCQL